MLRKLLHKRQLANRRFVCRQHLALVPVSAVLRGLAPPLREVPGLAAEVVGERIGDQLTRLVHARAVAVDEGLLSDRRLRVRSNRAVHRRARRAICCPSKCPCPPPLPRCGSSTRSTGKGRARLFSAALSHAVVSLCVLGLHMNREVTAASSRGACQASIPFFPAPLEPYRQLGSTQNTR